MEISVTISTLGKGTMKQKVRQGSTVADVIKKIGGAPANFTARIRGNTVPLETKLKKGTKIILAPKAKGG